VSATPPPAPVLLDGKYFNVSEMACHDGTQYPLEFADRWAILSPVLDAIREGWGSPVRIVSGYRSPAHNASLIAADDARGSHQVASGSQHVEGRAADLCPAEGPREIARFHQVILQLHLAGKLEALGGCAVYPTSGWVHVDVRPQVPPGHLATWPAV
jgi:Peptidase M15